MTPGRIRALIRDCPPELRAALVHVLATAAARDATAAARDATAAAEAEREAEYRALLPGKAASEPSAPEAPNGDAAEPANQFRARSPLAAAEPWERSPADVAAVARDIIARR